MQPGIAPTLGRIVHYTCDPQTAQKLNQLGGRKYNVGDIVPGMVVRTTENNSVSLKLHPEAEDDLLISNIAFSTGGQPNTWNWPERVGETHEAAA